MLILALAAPTTAEHGAGTGCEKRMSAVCPNWQGMPPAACVACVMEHLKQLVPNCTEAKAVTKCRTPPTTPPTPMPEPAPPALPPIRPTPGSLRPHVVMWVVDDQGFANVGFHNPNHVRTPTTDKLAADGIILDRHYTFRWCAPTRSALMTGRLPYHVLQSTNHVHRSFNMLPAKLRQVGYRTHQVGKWHLGLLEKWMTPVGRGFETSLGYLGGGEDHYTQMSTEYGCSKDVVDLYKSDAPAIGYNGTYGAHIYNAEGLRIIAEHDVTTPLFLYMALQDMHAPQQVPQQYSDLYPSPPYDSDYAIMNGMASCADSVLENVSNAMKANGMWDNTLLIYTADNGGPAGRLASGHSGNNWPLRGGKTNFFEGGVRVTAFVSGGAIPQNVRGTHLSGYIHVCDWYPTVLTLAGGIPTDDHPGLPTVDGYNMWPYVIGNTSDSPRTEIMIGSEQFTQKTGQVGGWNGALISGDYKLILGVQSYGFWQGPVYPNASTNHAAEVTFDCGDGCLFNIQDDPSEYNDLAKSQPEKLNMMRDLFIARNKTMFQAPKIIIPDATAKCDSYAASHGGFGGPYGS